MINRKVTTLGLVVLVIGVGVAFILWNKTDLNDEAVIDHSTHQGHAHAQMSMVTKPNASALSENSDIAYYTCPMHPSVKEHDDGQCPICSMDLVPVTKAELSSGAIAINAERRQLIGLKTQRAEIRQLTKTVRAVGKVTYDERGVYDVSLRFDGWIENLKANYVGAQVKKGEPLFSVYSPELLSAQREYLELRDRAARSQSNRNLLAAAKQRLTLWGISQPQISAIEKAGKPMEYLPMLAPASGVVIAKTVNDGSAVKTGERLFQIADLSTVWIDADVYESDLPLLKTGMPTTVLLPMQEGGGVEATIDYIYPYIFGQGRTGRIRLALNNIAGELKPDMFAEVHIQVPLGRRLVVPEEAVLFAGESQLVFKDLEQGGKLKPIKVITGQRAKGYIEIIEGLEPNDLVVTSGNFLVASEAKLKTGAKQW